MKKLFWLSLILLFSLFPLGSYHLFSFKKYVAPFTQTENKKLDDETTLALSQPFTYLGQGKQTDAFVSLDGNYVIKFFKKDYFQQSFLSSLYSKWRKTKAKREKFYKESYALAEDELKEETALSYLHFSPSSDLPTLQITDQLGIKKKIDLNLYPFVLQRKGILLYDASTQETIDSQITSFLTLVAKRIQKGIFDDDHEIENNFAVLDGKVFQLDPGRLYRENELHNEAKIKQQWWSATHRYRNFLQDHFPEKIPFFDAMLARAQSIQNDCNIDHLLQKGANRGGDDSGHCNEHEK